MLKCAIPKTEWQSVLSRWSDIKQELRLGLQAAVVAGILSDVRSREVTQTALVWCQKIYQALCVHDGL